MEKARYFIPTDVVTILADGSVDRPERRIDVRADWLSALSAKRKALLLKAYDMGMDLCEGRPDMVTGEIRFMIVAPGSPVELEVPYSLYQTSRKTPEIDAAVVSYRAET